MEQRQWINSLVPGQDVFGVYALGMASSLQSRNGPYWRLELRDQSGSVEAKIWHPLSTAFPNLTQGQVVEISGKAGQYKDQVQVSIENLRILDEKAINQHLVDLLPVSTRPPEEMLAEIEDLCRTQFSHKPWKVFALSVLADAKIRPRLLLAPAAKSVHHAYVGGLLEHTLSVAKLCLRMAEHYPQIDRQCLLAGALFHDIGKLEEMSGGLGNDYTDAGRLVGHITLGTAMLEPHLKKAKLEETLALHLRHLILSHHGETQFGAVREPATVEAFLLHFADNIDAKVAQCEGALTGVQTNTTEDPQQILWSPWQNLLGRSLCRPPRSPDPSARTPQGMAGDAKAMAKAEKLIEAKNSSKNQDSQCSLV